jgi:hypothetical protein
MIDLIGLLFGYMCECGLTGCKAKIALTDQSHLDFNTYNDQRDSYCLISKSCIGKGKISLDRVVVEGEDYWILQEEA